MKLFYEKFDNLIGLTDAGDEFPAPIFPRTVVNGDNARQKGIEGQFSWRPLQGRR